MKRVLSLILAVWAIGAMAQSEMDTVAVKTDNGVKSFMLDEYVTPGILQSRPIYEFSGDNSLSASEHLAPSLLDMPEPSPMVRAMGRPVLGSMADGVWVNGWFYAAGSTELYPGMLEVDQGRVGISRSIGDFSFSAYAAANKYGSYRNVSTNFGFGGRMSYRFTERLSLTAFGAYYNRAPYGPGYWQDPFLGIRAYPYMEVSNFGGYFTVEFSDNFGIDLGAQSYYDSYRHSLVTQPIVAPYAKIGKVKLQIDTGPIILELLRNVVSKHSKHW